MRHRFRRASTCHIRRAGRRVRFDERCLMLTGISDELRAPPHARRHETSPPPTAADARRRLATVPPMASLAAPRFRDLLGDYVIVVSRRHGRNEVLGTFRYDDARAPSSARFLDSTPIFCCCRHASRLSDECYFTTSSRHMGAPNRILAELPSTLGDDARSYFDATNYFAPPPLSNSDSLI